MHFTIKTATNLSGISVDLEKIGNKYSVVAYENGNGYRTIERVESSFRDNANALFEIFCDRYGMKVEKDVDTSEAYAFIASQHD